MLPYIEIFGTYIQSYYICGALAGIAGIGLSIRFLKQKRLGIWRFLLPIFMGVAALVGARLLNFLLNPSAYGSDFPAWTLAYRKLSLVGGLIFAGAVIFVFSYLFKRSPWPLLDAMIVPGGIAIMFLKLGCFLNGCCYGKSTGSRWGMIFPANEIFYDYLDTIPFLATQIRTVYPTQLYELMGAGLGLCVILPLMRFKKPPKGVGAMLYAMCFTLVRLLVHPLRDFPYEEVIKQRVYPVFYLLILLSLGIIIWIILKKTTSKNKYW